MDTLITDLLSLSRVSRAQLSFKMIDMAEMARSVFDELADEEVKGRLSLRVNDLPPAPGDPTLIGQVWTNLISNAIKYTRPRLNARIEIEGRQDEESVTYSVRDNGVGFDPAYKANLFGPFQRLHKDSEFEGTGIGLAIVNRIVQRHGGRVWGEGEVGKGAQFSFSLPLKPKS